jgi:uncharacterized membrane protein
VTCSANPTRLAVVDLARGLVVMLMALDHTRHLFHAAAFAGDPLDPDTTSGAVFATRWVTHLCAPVFVWLAGVSARLRLQSRGGPGDLAAFLASRGLWLIVLEVAVVNFAVNFSWHGVGLQVIWALGGAMLALAAMAWLPRRAVLAVGVALVAGHNLLDPIAPAAFGALAPLWTVLHAGGPIPGAPVFVIYPLLPWIGVMALGYGMTPLFEERPDRDQRFLVLGVASVAAFVLLRALNLYGDPAAWDMRADPLRSAFAFLNVQKYPPSLDYVLATLGVALMLIPVLARLPTAIRAVLQVFGRAPLFFYLAHFFLIHGLMTALGVARGLPAEVFVDVMADPSRAGRAGWGVGLAVVYALWALVLLALYPACRWFGALKARRTDWWLSYL